MDAQSVRDLLKGPGMDTRSWVSYGVVDKQTSEGDRPVEFTEEYGPIVNVTLQPSGIPVMARVGGFIAGAGEGSWYPIQAGDEVVVVLPDGMPSSAIIICRMNQQIDKFPTTVVGNDVSTNTFGFWRMIAPFVIEFKSSFQIFNPVHSAALVMEAGGNVTLRDGLLSFLHLGADFIGLQDNDGTLQLQMNLEDQTIRIAHNNDPGKPSVIFDINGESSQFATGGPLAIATAGNIAQFHGVTAESVMAMLMAFSQATAAAITSLGGPAAYLAAAWSLPGPLSAIPGAALVEASLPVANSLFLNSLFQQSLIPLFSVPKAPDIPGIACPGLTMGLAMGFPPPQDFPTPQEQSIATANASFEPGPDAASICGFKFPPKFNFGYGFNLPPIPIPFKLPSFKLSLGINCDLDNPFSLSAGVSFGGGRVAQFDTDNDEQDEKIALEGT